MKFLPHAVLAAAAVSLCAGLALAQSAGETVRSLRGVQVDEPAGVEDVFQQDKKRFVRNYRQQPPLIPHSIEQYQIDRNANECLACHDWANAGNRGAPTLSMTHYLDRDGHQLDTVSGTRWFCNQCHVPQADAPALVENIFSSSGR
ncbi:MAG: nitrate reductase cytochrome c-type subunit [Rhodobiaceae bacterium]|nr:nitrate reductase cytochrome c-type subunit [Rhodobiaceae bacterium]MCC0052549.1 nitrate reductase cytochrome c-type subunit [Rhodobiaceae bacterium]